jgi:type VI secretion system protein ImpH
MISHRFDSIPVRVQEFLPRRVPLRDKPRLGHDSRLGVNTLIGDSIVAPASRFRIVIGPLSRDTFEQFRPGSERIRMIKGMVDAYLADPLDYDIEVQLHRPELIPVVLGRDNAAIGRVASLGRSNKPHGAVRSVMVA